MNVVVLAGGVGGARFLRGARRCRRSGHCCHRRQRGGRRRDARAPHLARPRHDPLHAVRALRRGARLGTRRARPGTRSRRSPSSAAKSWFQLGDRDIGLHLVRTEALRAGEPLVRRDRAARARVRPRVRAAAGDRRPAAHLDRHAGRQLPVPDLVRRPRPSRRGRRASASRAPRRPGPAPGVLEALGAADLIVIAPSNPFVSDRADPRRRRDPRGDRAAHACRASRSAR